MKSSEAPEKTVYVLGAGFSAAAGGPNQSSLMRKILELDDRLSKVRSYKRSLQSFLVDALHADPRRLDALSLEDIFTPLDRCLADGASLRSENPERLREMRGRLEYLISVAIDQSFRAPRPRKDRSDGYADAFARYLASQAGERARRAVGARNADGVRSYDPFAIVSLNWDILLDNALYRALERQDRGEDGAYAPIGVVDYCCYVSSLDEGQRRVRPGLWTLGARGYNVKLLKIHGSMNWLQCSNCQRLFVGFGEKVNMAAHINVRTCRHCENHGYTAKLRGSLVMPTFLKDLSNFQIKLIWHNCGLELREARRLVFIGYSLPQADFEFRQLLTRTVHRDARIHVVLYDSGTPDGTRQYAEECIRYRQLFGGRRITFEPGGVAAYVRGLVGKTGRPQPKFR